MTRAEYDYWMAGLGTWLETLPGRYGDRPEVSKVSSLEGLAGLRTIDIEPALASSRCSLVDAGKVKVK